jgi:aspartate/methionine/tyrosine aminotransferase
MNPVFDQVGASLLRAVHDRKRPGDIDIGIGEPSLPLNMEPLEKGIAWVREHGCPYSANLGFPELRESIAAHFNYPCMSALENVCVTVGSQEALYLALRAALDPIRDELLIAEPCYPAYETICRLDGIRYRTVALDPTSGFAPNANLVLAAMGMATRAVLICSPNNPTGRVWPRRELEILARGLGTRPGQPVQVIWDEVHRELCYTEEPYTSIAEIYPYTWAVNSLSKSHALPGLRVGWLIAPREAVERVQKFHHLLVTSPDTISQRAAIHIFRDANSFTLHGEKYRARLTELHEILRECELEHVPLDGTFFCMLKLPEALAANSVAAAFRLLEEAHVVTMPGRPFGACAEGWARTSWAGEPEQFRTVYRRLKLYLALGRGFATPCVRQPAASALSGVAGYVA